VLDIGCGDGKLTSLIAPLVKKVIGVDHQEFPLNMAKLILKNHKVSNVEFIKEDGSNLKFEKDYFDKVICYDVIEHIPSENVDNFINNITKTLKKDGFLLLTTPNRKELKNRIFGHKLIDKHYYEYEYKELKNMFSRDYKNVRILGSYLPLIPLPKIEHFANIFPFRIFFKFMVDIGKNHPRLSRTLILIAQKK